MGALTGFLAGFLLSFITTFIYQVVLGKEGNKFLVYLISILIFVILGAIIGYLCGIPANIAAQKKASASYDTQIKNIDILLESNVNSCNTIKSRIDKLDKEKQITVASYSKQLPVYIDVKTIVLNTSEILYNLLIEKFNATLDCRD